MNIQIIGLGIVGKAQAKLMQNLGHNVTGYDIRPENGGDVPVTDTPVKDADLTFICPPEKAVPEVLENLVISKVHNPYVIKSTVPPGTTEAAMLKYGIHVCHNPEFLREETAVEDALNQKFVIIGECCPRHGDMLAELYAPLKARIIRTRPNTSEMAKLVLNNYLATLITFWNEVDNICTMLNLDTGQIADIIKHDSRVSEYGTAFFGQAFGGKCLPKDLDQTLELCHARGMTPRLFETIRDFNTELALVSSFRPQKVAV